MLKKIMSLFPPVKRLLDQRAALLNELSQYKGLQYPPGHFYSPIPSIEEVREDKDRLFSRDRELKAVDLNEAAQIQFYEKISRFYGEIPFTAVKSPENRYYFENRSYEYSDGICLYCMLRELKPKKVIEAGAGFSTSLMLDTNDRFLDRTLQIDCIDPVPGVLLSLMRDEDKMRVRLHRKKLQQVDPGLFATLEAGDILFIDSTHVSKIGSDVNYLIHEILPALKKGVYIHFHDIYYPFEYLPAIVTNGIHWNEAYILQAFLEYNKAFSIILFNSFLEHRHRKLVESLMPLCLKNGGGSIWLRKEAD